ncbi:MAG TPA: transcriptional regulator [Gammaproteobacteria bacterium]|nr:transcriptional regulator [Gammaproteobacteria bacterium]
MTKKESYQEYLINSLKDPKEAVGYLNAALEGGNIQVFLLALYNVIQAQGGISKLSENTHKSRTSLYKALSRKGNPYLKSTNEILTAIGMHFQIAARNTRRRRKISKAA